VDVNAKDDLFGWAPLYSAVWNVHKETAELLITAGADVNTNYHGNSEEEYVADSDRHVILDMWLCDACMCAHNHEK